MARTHSSLWRTQNFLRDPRLALRLVRQAGIADSDLVYDLGAGTGNITAVLARHAGRVVAIEKDAALARLLRRRFALTPNVAVIEGDLLAHPLPDREYLVFASPPFDRTADLVRRLTSADHAPRDAWLVLQREAAARFTGTPRTTLSALLIAPWFALDIVYRFDRSDFVPRPSVDAVFVRLHKRGPPLVPGQQSQLYRDFVVSCFTTRDATVRDALARRLGSRAAARLLRAAPDPPTAVPSAVPPAAWLALFRTFARAPLSLRVRVRGAEARLRRQQRRLEKRHRTRTPRDGLPRATVLTRPGHASTLRT